MMLALSQLRARLQEKTNYSTKELAETFRALHGMPHLFSSEEARSKFKELMRNFEDHCDAHYITSWGRRQVSQWLSNYVPFEDIPNINLPKADEGEESSIDRELRILRQENQRLRSILNNINQLTQL